MEPLELRLALAILAPISDVSTGAISVEAAATFEYPYLPYSDSGIASLDAEDPFAAGVFLVEDGLTGFGGGGVVSAFDSFDYPDDTGYYHAQISSDVFGGEGNIQVVTGRIFGTAYANKSVKMRIEPENALEMLGDPVTVHLNGIGFVESGGYASLLLKVGSLPAYSFIPVSPATEPENASKEFTARIGDTVSLDVQTSASVANTDGERMVSDGAIIIQALGVVSTPLPDLAAVDVDANVDEPAHPKVEYSYEVLETTDPDVDPQPEITEPFTIGFYWATSPDFEDRIGEPAHTITVSPGPDTQVGLHSGSFDATVLASQRPPNAKYIVMKVDSGDAIPELGEDNNVSAAKLPVAPTLVVTAQYDDEGSKSDKDFGLYLAGVNLKNKFTVSADDLDNQINSIKYAFDAAPTINAQSAGPHQWTFVYNVGKLTAETNSLKTHKLNVAAFDASGNQISATFTGDVIVSKKLNFELQAKAGASLMTEEDLRFLSGVKANIAFTGTINGLPQFYQNQLKVFVGAAGTKLTFDSNQDRTAIFHFNYDTSKLKAGPKGAAATTQVKAVVRHPVDVVFGDAAEKLTAIGIPDWLKPKTKTFDSELGEYALNDAALKPLKWDAKQSPTLPKWIKQALPAKVLQTSIHVTPWLDLTVPLDKDEPIDWEGSRLTAGAILFGNRVFDETYASDKIEFYGQIDAMTLHPNDFGIKLKQPLTLFDGDLMNVKMVKYPIPVNVPDWVFNASVAFSLQAMATVTIDAGVEINWAGSSVNYVAADDLSNPTSGTFFKIHSDPSATATFEASASVFKGWLLDATATGSVMPTLTLDAAVSFSGPVTSAPKFTWRATADFSADFDFDLKGSFLGIESELFNLKEDAPEFAKFAPVNLFTLGT